MAEVGARGRSRGPVASWRRNGRNQPLAEISVASLLTDERHQGHQVRAGVDSTEKPNTTFLIAHRAWKAGSLGIDDARVHAQLTVLK